MAKSSLSAKQRVIDKQNIVKHKTVIEHSPKHKTVIEHSRKHKTVIEHSPKHKTVIEHSPKHKTVIEHLSSHKVSPKGNRGKKRPRGRSPSPPARKQLLLKESGRLSRKDSLKAMSQISSSKIQGRVKTLDPTVSELMDAALQPCSVDLRR